MKMRKVISTVLAGVLALSALPISSMSAGAEGAYAPGDVDMDGFVTAHDAAVVILQRERVFSVSDVQFLYYHP